MNSIGRQWKKRMSSEDNNEDQKLRFGEHKSKKWEERENDRKREDEKIVNSKEREWKMRDDQWR